MVKIRRLTYVNCIVKYFKQIYIQRLHSACNCKLKYNTAKYSYIKENIALKQQCKRMFLSLRLVNLQDVIKKKK